VSVFSLLSTFARVGVRDAGLLATNKNPAVYRRWGRKKEFKLGD